jgi:transglutaminase-like putative cysteine protease
MKRRTFLSNSLALSAGVILSGVPKLESSEKIIPDSEWRTFEITTTVEISDPTGTMRLWLPVPLREDTDYFQHVDHSWTGNFKDARNIKYDSFGTGILFAEWKDDEKSPRLEFNTQFKTKNRQIDFSTPSKTKEDPEVLNQYRKPSRLIQTDGIVAETAQKIVNGKKNDLDKARAIYEWIVENTFRDPKVRGCGVGDISSMLKTENLGGKCADLNGLFVGLARGAGLPARDVYGIRCAKSAEFNCLGRADDITGAQHCRAEVYLSDFGWVPVDPADVRKVILEENPQQQLTMEDPQVKKARAKLFGSWEMNWLPYNYAHDVRLPNSNGPEIAFLMYPQAETSNGRKDCLDAKNFKYTIRATEIVA